MKQKLDIEKIKELETIAKELDAEKFRLYAVSRCFLIIKYKYERKIFNNNR